MNYCHEILSKLHHHHVHNSNYGIEMQAKLKLKDFLQKFSKNAANNLRMPYLVSYVKC